MIITASPNILVLCALLSSVILRNIQRIKQQGFSSQGQAAGCSDSGVTSLVSISPKTFGDHDPSHKKENCDYHKNHPL